jgi:hypothetical protein
MLDVRTCSCLQILLILTWCSEVATKLLISNADPKLDVNGDIVNAHDGSLARFERGNESLYYLYGTRYRNCTPTRPECCATDGCCGWDDNDYIVYSSPTMESGTWTLR